MEMNIKPIIYQVFPRLFGNDNSRPLHNGDIHDNGCGKMNDFTPKVLNEIKKLNVTYIWYTGIIEHATQTDYSLYSIRKDHPAIVKGKAGSPYAIKDYYDVDPDLAVDVPNRMKEFEDLVKRTHDAGMKVVIDFVANHVARQYHSDSLPKGVADLGAKDNPKLAFSTDNNFYYIPDTNFKGDFDLRGDASEEYKEYPAKVTGNNRFDATTSKNDWYETVKLNYGVDFTNGSSCHFKPIPNTWTKMLNILKFWCGRGIDGFRCDMAEMVPIEFWHYAIDNVKDKYPDVIFIAEVYNPSDYYRFANQGGFDYLYDKVGLYDTLRGIVCGYKATRDITGCWQSLNGIAPKMLNFMENHDEQRIASDFFANDSRKGFAPMIVCTLMNINPVMIYSGQEFGERGMDDEGFSGFDGRTTIFDYWSISTIRRWRNGGLYDDSKLDQRERETYKFYQKLTKIAKEPAIVNGLFFDLMYVNGGNWDFDDSKQYAFLRRVKDELLFIIVNFKDSEADVSVNIPSHAFDYLQIPQCTMIKACDLLSGDEEILSLVPYQSTITHLPAFTGKVLKMKL
jgi:glycosidase